MGQSPWPTGLQSSFLIWTLLRSSFTGCNPELAIHSSLKLLHCISCSWTATFSCPECNIDSRFSTLDYRILLVQGFGNETSTKTIAGKLFGKMVAFGALPVWCSVYQCQTAQQNARKTPPVLEKIRFFNIHLWTWAMRFSNLFMVFSFRFIQLIASCRQSFRAHYRTLTGSIVRKLLCQSLTKNPRALSLCATDVP